MIWLGLYAGGAAATFLICVWSQRFDDGDVPTWLVAWLICGGRGTADMVRRAREAGIAVAEIRSS